MLGFCTHPGQAEVNPVRPCGLRIRAAMPRRKRYPIHHPRYWSTWLAMGLLWLFAKLAPYRLALFLGRGIGWLGYHLAAKRRHITEVNIAICFPELDDSERQQRVREHFASVGTSLLLLGFSWWASDEKLRPLAHTEGFQQIDAAIEQGRGVILLGVHFTDLDIVGRLLAMHHDFAVVYRQHENPVIEWALRRSRERHFAAAIPRNDVRKLLRTLKRNIPVWIAADQVKRGKYSVLVPFFGEPAATSTITSRIAAIGKSPVLPSYGYRLPGATGFRVAIEAPLEAFPTGDPVTDISRTNRVIERVVRQAPAQYLWSHRRFKKRPGLPDPY